MACHQHCLGPMINITVNMFPYREKCLNYPIEWHLNSQKLRSFRTIVLMGDKRHVSKMQLPKVIKWRVGIFRVELHISVNHSASIRPSERYLDNQRWNEHANCWRVNYFALIVASKQEWCYFSDLFSWTSSAHSSLWCFFWLAALYEKISAALVTEWHLLWNVPATI